MPLTPEQIKAIRQEAGVSETPSTDTTSVSLTERLGLPSQSKTSIKSALSVFSPKGAQEDVKNFYSGEAGQENSQLAKMQGSDVGRGVVKGAVETAMNIGTGLQNVGQVVTGQNTGFKTLDTGTQENVTAKDYLQAKSPEETVGKGIERTAEFFVPGALGVKAPATANFLTKALVEGLGTAAISTAQTGSLEKGVQTGLLAGGTSAALGGAKAGLNYFGVPEKLYNTIFKSNTPSMVQELRSEGIKNLQQTNPEQFASLVKDGIIKMGNDGSTQINESLAKQALDRGLKGSIDNMSNGVVMNLLTNEQNAQTIAKTAKQTIKVPEKQFANVFGEIAQDYENVGFGDTARRADELKNAFSSGEASVKDVLDARRLLDGLRVRSSFVPDTKLSTSQENLKFLADQLRTRLSKVDGMGEVMKDYSFNIQALEALAKEAVRRGNSNVITLVEGTLLGSGSPVGAGIYAGKKLINTPSGVTNLGSAIAGQAEKSTTGQALRGIGSQSLIEGFGSGN